MNNPANASSNSNVVTLNKKLKRGLRIQDNYIVNLDNVCTCYITKDTITLDMSNQEIVNVYLKDSESHRLTSEINDFAAVEVNEFKRIEREVLEYMGD